MWAEVERIMADKTVQLAVTPTLEIHVPEALRRRATVVGYGELIRWTSLVRGMIQQGKVGHSGSAVLAEHMNRAVGVRTAQGYVVSSQKSPGPIELARCLIWAVALESKPQTRQKPILVVG